MEAQIVLTASIVGSVISALLVIDAHRDVRLVEADPNLNSGLEEIAHHRLLSESIRLALQLMFLGSALVFVLDRSTAERRIATWLLVFVPIVLAGWSIYSWIRRRRLIKKHS